MTRLRPLLRESVAMLPATTAPAAFMPVADDLVQVRTDLRAAGLRQVSSVGPVRRFLRGASGTGSAEVEPNGSFKEGGGK
jgi:hypothetical protein